MNNYYQPKHLINLLFNQIQLYARSPGVRKYNHHLLDKTDDFRRHDTIKNHLTIKGSFNSSTSTYTTLTLTLTLTLTWPKDNLSSNKKI